MWHFEQVALAVERAVADFQQQRRQVGEGATVDAGTRGWAESKTRNAIVEQQRDARREQDEARRAAEAEANSFATRLEHFAHSVDVVDSNIFDGVRAVVCKYVENELKGSFELLRQDDGHLRTFWRSDDDMTPRTCPIERLGANSLTDVAISKKPLWLVSPDKTRLDRARTYRDLWSGTTTETPYLPSGATSPAKTVIIVPLIPSPSSFLGIYCIEILDYVEATEVAKTELVKLAKALATLYSLWEANHSQWRAADSATSDLRGFLDHPVSLRLGKPAMFVAYPTRADANVRSILLDVLDQFAVGVP